jgi:hypothetical protein
LKQTFSVGQTLATWAAAREAAAGQYIFTCTRTSEGKCT